MRIGTTGIEPPAEIKSMTNDFNSTPLTSTMRPRSGRVQHRNVGGVLFMNITKPKPIPADICNRCLEELENQIIQLEVKKQNCTIKEHLPAYKYETHKLALQQLYYTECKRLFMKGQQQ